MKLLLLSIVVAVAAGAHTDPDFTAFLNQIFGHASFQRLPDEDRLLFSELVMAAEQHELETFIDRIGLLKVIELVDREYRLLFVVTVLGDCAYVHLCLSLSLSVCLSAVSYTHLRAHETG